MFIQVHFGVDSQSLVIRMFSFWYKESTFLRGVYDLLLGRKWEVGEPFLHLFQKCLQLTVINRTNSAYFEVACSYLVTNGIVLLNRTPSCSYLKVKEALYVGGTLSWEGTMKLQDR